jgi:hypothetical protein
MKKTLFNVKNLLYKISLYFADNPSPVVHVFESKEKAKSYYKSWQNLASQMNILVKFEVEKA